MNFEKLFKKVQTTHVIIILAGLGLVYALYNYSQNKSSVKDGMMNSLNQVIVPQAEMSAENAHVSSALAESVGGQKMIDPAELLPRDENSEWAQLNPIGSGDLQNVNLLQAGHHIGINTVSSSLRNASLDIRGDVPNPQTPVGPWNQTTIQPDVNRRPLEIGSTPM